MPKYQPQPSAAKGASSKAPLIVEPKCLVCKSPHRHLVDKMLVSGMTYSEIERQFAFAGLKRRSIAGHREKHLGHEEAAIREIIERETAENFEEGKARLITKNTYLEVALQKAYDALISDTAIVEPKDAVKVIEVLTKMQQEQQGVAIDELRVQFQMFLQAVKEIVPKENWDSIVERTKELLAATGRDAGVVAAPAQLETAVDAEVIT